MSSAFRTKYGPWALVAGASEGIGKAFAAELAARGLHLVLVARRAALLDDLAAQLRAAHGVEVRTASIDLASPSVLDEVRAATEGLEVGLVVYNAAYSLVGRFLDQPLADKLRIVDVNCRGPLILADTFGRDMVARGRGGIIIMASLAAAQGTAFVATYAASKAFDLVLAESLWDELRDHGVDVLACRAGATRTPAYERSRPASEPAPVMEPEAVAREALAALGKTPSMVTGLLNGAVAFLMGRVLPRRAAVSIMGRATRKMYG
ncbi:putative short chain dehydrogenase [Minicystis rosea]|nr:putative short chain dehydrogenase [Minicystis rosea]